MAVKSATDDAKPPIAKNRATDKAKAINKYNDMLLKENGHVGGEHVGGSAHDNAAFKASQPSLK